MFPVFVKCQVSGKTTVSKDKNWPAVGHIRLFLYLYCWHPIWVSFQVPAVLPPIQISASEAGKAAESGPEDAWPPASKRRPALIDRLLAANWTRAIAANWDVNQQRKDLLSHLVFSI